MIRRLLIANRGEIAIRIARGAREMGISPVGVYSDADERAAFRDELDASVRIGPGPATESYLNIDAIVNAARTLGADAVHPGYGFLSERAPFAQAVLDAGLIFVGPAPAAIAAVGSKSAAKQLARAAGVPVVDGYDGADQTGAVLKAEAAKLGPPLVIKALAGGGGRGMRVVNDLAGFDEALQSARREALAAFGDETVLLERYLHRPRHVEFQILADAHGAIVHAGERDCSIQRRHQKVVEEAPSPALTPDLRARMGAAAVAVARAAKYTNAGTVEFLLAADGTFAFLEMNARLQVEHPVTELVYGVDLVHEQLRIANGEPLRFTQTELQPRGCAIEVRMNAEDPAHDYAPQAGKILILEVPRSPGVRFDTGIPIYGDVPVFYDALFAKLIVWGEDRPAAIARLRATLDATRIWGLPTNLALLRAIARDDAFAAADTTTSYLAERGTALEAAIANATRDSLINAAGKLLRTNFAWRQAGIGQPLHLEIDGNAVRATADRTEGGWRVRGDVEADIPLDGPAGELAGNIQVTLPSFTASARTTGGRGNGRVNAHMPGTIVSVAVAAGDAVAARDLLIVLEAMKMEHRIEAPIAGTISALHVAPGDVVAAGTRLVDIGAA